MQGRETLPFAVRDRMRSLAGCETREDKIGCTLDAHGPWSQIGPIGEYQATVKVGSDGLVADFMKNVYPNVASWICEVKANEICTMHPRAR